MDTSNPSQPKGKRSGLRDKADSLGREAYWVTLSAKDDAKPFGSTRGGETILNARGKALAASWRELADIRPALEPDALVIGPRRLQGLLIFPPGKAGKGKGGGKTPVALAEAVRLFKVLSSLRLAQLGKTDEFRNAPVTGAPAVPGAARAQKAPPALWKKGFTEKVVSGSAGLAEARKALKGLQAR
ncbi:MAG TPA: hypothetical protein VJ385_17725 [Fibrobacteria bacterium]|nr:hypothetical protein [Fibrobacteria bacterium]